MHSSPSDRRIVPRDSRDTSAAASAFLDTLRFLAVNLVVLTHVKLALFDNQLADSLRGLAAVTLFVLSGFLIARSLAFRTRQPGTQLPGFLADRVARIMTPLVPVLLMVAALNATVIRGNWSLEGLSSGFAALIGNLLMLSDYPLFQLLNLAHIDVGWRIRAYNTAGQLWTLPIQFWIYVAAGLLTFGLLLREKIRPAYLWILTLISVPVVIWNAADGVGKGLSLMWTLGGLAGFLAVHVGTNSKIARSKSLANCVLAVGVAALSVYIATIGFQPYDLESAFLLTVIFFGLFLRFNQATTVWRVPAAIAKFFASYSYSLYLVHNTVLVLVIENMVGLGNAWTIGIVVVLSHVTALLVYHAFEKRHRSVSRCLKPIFARRVMRADVTVELPVQGEPNATSST